MYFALTRLSPEIFCTLNHTLLVFSTTLSRKLDYRAISHNYHSITESHNDFHGIIIDYNQYYVKMRLKGEMWSKYIFTQTTSCKVEEFIIIMYRY